MSSYEKNIVLESEIDQAGVKREKLELKNLKLTHTHTNFSKGCCCRCCYFY